MMRTESDTAISSTPGISEDAVPAIYVAATQPKSKQHIAALDGIRAFAVAGVLAIHFGLPYSGAGFLGVDAFFVLSGFLITALMCREYENKGTVSVGSFWMRRALRLLPAYYLYVLCVSMLMLASGLQTFRQEGVWSPTVFITSLWLYFINYAPWLGWKWQMGTVHLWSLAVEQQFYLIWPFVFLSAFAVRRPLAVVAALFTLVGTATIVLAARGYPTNLLYTRGAAILAGCLAAVACAPAESMLRGWVTRAGVRAMAWLSVIGIVALSTWWATVLPAFKYSVWPTLSVPFSVMVAVVVAGLWHRSAGLRGPERILAWGPFVYLGRISYGVYLYHMCVAVGVKMAATALKADFGWNIRYAAQLLVFLILSIGMAVASYHLIEEPVNRLSRRFRA